MLSVFDEHDRFGRRAFLRIGSLGLGGLALEDVLSAATDQQGRSALAGKSVIFLFLHGGPSQIETFDPKMTAPSEIRSTTGEIATRLPGITFGGSFPKLAQLADQISVVRSFQTGNGNHDIKPVMSSHSLEANLGSLYSRVAGTTNSSSGVPTNIALFPRAIDEATQPAVTQFGRFDATGRLGAAYAPFVLGSGQLQHDMKLRVAPERLADRRHLLAKLDRGKAMLDEASGSGAVSRFRQQAFETILGSAADAFDVTKEDPTVVARYDTAPLVRPDQISRDWNNYNNYVDNAKTLGKLLLLARRLCERGCGFVTVTTNFVWDMHADINNAGVKEGMQYMGLPLDHALSAYIEDVETRGLRDKILLVVCGEMGRTPKINKKGGRDHWGRLAPLMLYGGGLKMGRVVGQSSRDAAEPATRAYGIDHLIATVMGTLLDTGQVRLMSNLPVELVRVVTGSAPITELTV